MKGTYTIKGTPASSVLVCTPKACGMMCTGVYSLRKMLPDDDRISTALFFGYVGLFNLVSLAPVVSPESNGTCVDESDGTCVDESALVETAERVHNVTSCRSYD
eukprot:1177318-Prorocentrum_minimum.AAC.2